MKKTFLIFLSFLLIFSMTACVSNGDTAAAEPAAEAGSGFPISGEVSLNPLVVIENHQYGKNYQFAQNVLPEDYKAKAGDVITLHIEGTVDKAVVLGVNDAGTDTVFEIYPVDTTEAASWWTPLVSEDNYFRTSEAIGAGESFSFDMTFTLEKNSTAAASSGGVKLCIGSAHEQAEEVSITTTSFTYEIVR